MPANLEHRICSLIHAASTVMCQTTLTVVHSDTTVTTNGYYNVRKVTNHYHQATRHNTCFSLTHATPCNLSGPNAPLSQVSRQVNSKIVHCSGSAFFSEVHRSDRTQGPPNWVKNSYPCYSLLEKHTTLPSSPISRYSRIEHCIHVLSHPTIGAHPIMVRLRPLMRTSAKRLNTG